MVTYVEKDYAVFAAEGIYVLAILKDKVSKNISQPPPTASLVGNHSGSVLQKRQTKTKQE
jgi:hypothetical protein